jgi:uncharacterized repeat protein (TIGR03803 family)
MRKAILRIIVGIFAIMALLSMLGGSAWSQVTYKTLHAFKGGTDGSDPYSGVVFDTAGNLYGTTVWGGGVGSCYGNPSCGTVFMLSPNAQGGWTETVLYRFTDGSDGALPYGGLIFDARGDLYGSVEFGMGNIGAGFPGGVFELSPNTNGGWTESTVLPAFDGCGAYWPQDGLILDAEGNLYYTVPSGFGTVCKLTENPDGSWQENAIYQFTGGEDGAIPYASLIFDAAGNLYGTTAFGGGSTACYSQYWGQGGCGIVFKLTPRANGSWTEHVLHRFTGGEDGANPSASLILDGAGNLYTSTISGGAYGYGNIFQLVPNATGGWAGHPLHQFTGGKDGGNPSAPLVVDSARNLYGTASKGGAYGYGVVFELTLTPSGGWGYQVLHQFADHTGAYPYAGLTFGTDGNLYGTTYGDGTTTFGSVFEITP